MNTEITIGHKKIGSGSPVFVIAEIGTNHNRDLNKAKALIDAAAEAKADAVKFQLYDASDIVNKSIPSSQYGFENSYEEQTAYEIFDQYFRTPKQWFPFLSNYAKQKGLIPIATSHSVKTSSLLKSFGMEALKIASMDFNNLDLMKASASVCQLPLILSTGMSTLAEIDHVVTALKSDNLPFCLLHCISNYPPDSSELHLGNISFLKTRHHLVVGFSDHTLDALAGIAAVCLGADIIEKHITLNRKDKGPDHAFAMEPEMLKHLVADIRTCEKMITSSRKFTPPSPLEYSRRDEYRRSIVARHFIPKGKTIMEDDLQISRPGDGIEPSCFNHIIGSHAIKDIREQTPITWNDIDINKD